MILVSGKGGYGWYVTNTNYLGTYLNINITEISIFGSGESMMGYYNNPAFENDGITIWNEKGFVALRFSNQEIVNKLPIGTMIAVKGLITR